MINKRGGEKMDGLMMAARFSLGCEESTLFPQRQEALLRFLNNPQDFKRRKTAEEILEQFRVLFPYLSLIGKANGLEPFSQKVVEAYFIGNKLLKRVSPKEASKTISQIYSQDILLGKDFFPHHNWHLLIVLPQVQRAKLPLSLFNFCLIRLARVEEVAKDKIRVRSQRLEIEEGKLKINWRGEDLSKERVLIEEIKTKEMVALHWQYICAKLKPREVHYLESYTSQALNYAKIRGE